MTLAHGLRADAVLSVARRMRASDRAEVFALAWPGLDTPEALTDEVLRVSLFGATIHSLDGQPQAALGLAPMWPGVFAAWMFATDRWGEVWRATVRRGIAMRDEAAAAGMHRAQAWSAAGHDAAHAFCRALGLRQETPAPVRLGRDREAFLLFGWERA